MMIERDISKKYYSTSQKSDIKGEAGSERQRRTCLKTEN